MPNAFYCIYRHGIYRFSTLRLSAAALAALAACGAMAAEPQAADSGNTLLIGGGVAVGQRYSGSKDNAVAPLVLLDYSMANGFFASTMRGLGYGGQVNGFSYGAALGYRGGRKEKDEKGLFGNTGGTRLQGMGDIKGNASAALSVGYSPLPGFQLGLSADVPLSQKDNGKNLHVSASGQLYGQGNDSVSLGLSAGFADSKYAQTYFGVSQRQATTSHFNAYKAGSGLYEVSAMLTWEHKIDAKWNVTSMLGATRLVKDAGRSPLSERKTAPTAAVYATYNY